MFAHLKRMAFFNESAISDQLYYLGGFSALEAEGPNALVALIRGAIQKRRATLLVVDGLISAQESTGTDSGFKKFLHEIQTLADLTRCTVLLLTNAQRASAFFPEHTMVDGVLHLTDELSELRPLRHIRVLKLRGSAPVRGLHSVRITDEGFEVTPRIETRLPQGEVNEEGPAWGPKVPLGVAALDEMLRGGVRTGSITMLLGSSGSGKTLLGMQFLAEGVRRGEHVVYFGFYERPEAILAKCQRVGIGGLKEGVDKGLALTVWHRPVEGVIDEIGESLIQTVRSFRPQRLLLDGMEGFERAVDFPERMSHVYSAIAQELERLGVTTLYTTETRALFGKTIEVPINGLSAATQNIIVLRHVEHRASLLRALAILKVRDSDYDTRMRELRITDGGIQLLDTFAGESGVASGGGVSNEPRTTEPE
jgi:circadian clock protein KaiC